MKNQITSKHQHKMQIHTCTLYTQKPIQTHHLHHFRGCNQKRIHVNVSNGVRGVGVIKLYNVKAFLWLIRRWFTMRIKTEEIYKKKLFNQIFEKWSDDCLVTNWLPWLPTGYHGYLTFIRSCIHNKLKVNEIKELLFVFFKIVS